MEIIAAAIINGGVNPSFTNQDGFRGITRNGAGDYTLTLDDSYGADEITVQCTLAENASGIVVGVVVSGNPTTTIRVKWAGADDLGVDVDYYATVVALPVN